MNWVAEPRYVESMSGLLDDIGFEPGLLVPRVVALAEAAVTPEERSRGVVAVCVNEEFTEVVVYREGQIDDLFVIPLGKARLDAKLASACGISLDLMQRIDLGRMLQSAIADPLVQRVRTIVGAWSLSLMRAIRLLEMAGVVHGRISPATVRWFDVEATAQLTDFSEAVMTGDPRKAGGEAPWASAEQQSGTGLADARDDVWSAAQVIHYVVTGRLVRGRGAQPDPSPRAVALQAAFGRALDPSIESRPRARELLEKLGARDPQAPKRTPQDQAFAEGLRKFDEETAKKFPGSQRPQAGGGPSSTTPPPPSHQRKAQPPRKKGFRGWFSASLIARIGIAAFLSWWWS